MARVVYILGTMNDEIKLFAAGVLAGAYKGADISDRALLKHAVADAAVTVGRLKREAGEALCNRKVNTVDSYVWEPVSEVTCPKCREIAARLAPAPSVRSMSQLRADARNGDASAVAEIARREAPSAK